MLSLLKTDAAAVTDIGRVRRSNQDSFGADEALGLYVVCDGMGGVAGGEIASRIAVDTFLTIARQELESLHGEPAECTRCALKRAAVAANRAVFARAQQESRLRGMGSTLVAARLDGSALTLVNVGDSRAYLIRSAQKPGSAARQLTLDHSYVAEQVRIGTMTPAQARASVMQSVITRAIGADPDVLPDLFEATLAPGDTLLLTSDGLTRHADLDTLAAIVSDTAADTPGETARRLVAFANAQGGHDNITCIVIRQSRD
jgi:protein phosphatase